MSIIRKAPFGHVVTAFLQSSSCRRGSVRLVFALALTFALAACDDDESSFVRPGEDSSSSVCENILIGKIFTEKTYTLPPYSEY